MTRSPIRRPILALVRVLALALAVTPPAWGLDLIRDNQTYLVRGDSAEEIRASLDQLGPIDPASSRRFDAYTRWHLEWRFDSRGAFNACEIARVWTTLRVTMIMPPPRQPLEPARGSAQRLDPLPATPELP